MVTTINVIMLFSLFNKKHTCCKEGRFHTPYELYPMNDVGHSCKSSK